MSSNQPAISISNVAKSYQIYARPADRLKQSLYGRLQKLIGRQPKKYFREFWALKGVSLDIQRGETLGVIGRNGSGKSTLLQIICGTLSPSQGDVQTKGRIAALLELGAGFNPELTGRENVYINGAILGLSHDEIAQRFDAIAAFADIGDFIDQPVKTYSSGMYVRLAFAVQAQIDPDILVVDEALAVGDAKFQAKCFARLKVLKESGTCIIFVTHDSEQIVRHCDRALLLDHGEMVMLGEPKAVVNRYLDTVFGRDPVSLPESAKMVEPAASSHQLSLTHDLFAMRAGYNKNEYRWGDQRACILDYALRSDGRPFTSQIETGSAVTLDLAVRLQIPADSAIFGFTLKSKEGIAVYGTNSEYLGKQNWLYATKDGTAIVKFSFQCNLAPGDYFISVGVASREENNEIVPHDRRYDSIHFTVPHHGAFFGIADLKMDMTLEKDPE